MFCEPDRESTANIRDVATRHGVNSVRVLTADGMGSVRDAIASLEPSLTAVFIDPFDHRAVGSAGLSALDVAAEAARSGALLVHWNGYNRIDQRRWLLNALTKSAEARSWWCCDLMVSAENATSTSQQASTRRKAPTSSARQRRLRVRVARRPGATERASGERHRRRPSGRRCAGGSGCNLLASSEAVVAAHNHVGEAIAHIRSFVTGIADFLAHTRWRPTGTSRAELVLPVANAPAMGWPWEDAPSAIEGVPGCGRR